MRSLPFLSLPFVILALLAAGAFAADDLARHGRQANDARAKHPHGDGSPDSHLAELYDLEADPNEIHNLVADPAHAATLSDLEKRLADLLAAHGLTPETDTMPLDEGIKTELPEARVR